MVHPQPTPECIVLVQAPLPDPVSADVHIRRQQMKAQTLRSLPPTWATQVPDLGLALVSFREANQQVEDLSFLTLSFK